MAQPTWAFLGTSTLSTIVLDKLKKEGFLPSLIVTVPDKPKGRKLTLTPPETKVWAEGNGISVLQPKTLRDVGEVEKIKSYFPNGADVFVVASYGKIITKEVLDFPKHGVVNVHPSLLPKLRGASPISSAILEKDETGVTIMSVDVEMDHGPIIVQEKVVSWGDANEAPYSEDLEKTLAEKGAEMLIRVMQDLPNMKKVEQDHSQATECGKMEKSDGELNFNESAEKNLRKIKAYSSTIGTYFFYKNKDKTTRIIVKCAHIENGDLILDRIIPEGKKEMEYKDFLKGN